jgi:NAD(P) transhydrogenase subunit alpha
VIVDLAGESGGNCALTRGGESVEAHGVTILAPLNLPAEMPVHASQMYARNVAMLLLEMVDKETKGLKLDFENDILGPCCVTHGGEVRHEPTRERLAAAPSGD